MADQFPPGTPERTARPPGRLARLFAFYSSLVTTFAILVTARVIDELPPSRAAEAWFAARHRVLLLPLVVAAGVGFVLFMGAAIWLAVAGRHGEGKATFREVKRAFHTGAWRQSPRWRRMFLMLLGVALLTFGLFGLGVVVGPGSVKLLCSLALLWAFGMTVYGFVRA